MTCPIINNIAIMKKKRIIGLGLLCLAAVCAILVTSATEINSLTIKDWDVIRVQYVLDPGNSAPDSFNNTAGRTGLLWWVIVLVTGGVGVAVFFLMHLRKRSIINSSPQPSEMEEAVDIPPLPTPKPKKNIKAAIQAKALKSDIDQNKPKLVGVPEIIDFFMNIFRLHMGASPEDPTKIEKVPDAGTGSETVFRLHVLVNGEWKYRGISIAPLGEGTGSKSRCFYVIFDNHMVIKIPPKPIQDFSDYFQSIRYEGRLVRKLAPRECIIPNLSVIMSKYRVLPKAEKLSANALERKYIELFESSTDHYDCLKIGGNFAFFMNLSKYYFLSHVIRRLHETQETILEMITSDAKFILDFQEFEHKYGQENNWICFELQKVFHRFEEGISDLEAQFGAPFNLSERQKMKWLFEHITLQDLTPQGKDLPDDILPEIETLLYDITDNATETIMTYKKLAHKHAEARIFKRTGPMMEGIITNLLGLLDWMVEKDVAMRDLKPDNLYVAGDPANYPQFLTSTKEYAIGLIDLENAVDYNPPRNTAPEQPLLGGTPAYATPSHFFSNKMIDEIYNDLPSILHFQDWYAAIGIIFEVVTGKRLFKQTSGEIHALVKRLNKGLKKGESLLNVYSEESRLFWKSAVAEFEMNIHENRKRLKALKARLPETMQRQFKIYLVNEMLKTDNLMRDLIEGETAFQAEEACEQLLTCSYEEIRDKIENQKVKHDPSVTQELRLGAIKTLEDLAGLKKRSALVTELLNKVVNNPTRMLSVRILLQLMFNVVSKAMFLEEHSS